MRLRDGRDFDCSSALGVVRHNVYDCERGHSLLSADLDDGVTPMFTTCPADGTRAVSRMFRVGLPEVVALLPVAMVWRLATNGERKRELRERGRGGHYALGGLAREWNPDHPLIRGRP